MRTKCTEETKTLAYLKDSQQLGNKRVEAAKAAGATEVSRIIVSKKTKGKK